MKISLCNVSATIRGGLNNQLIQNENNKNDASRSFVSTPIRLHLMLLTN